MYGYLYGCSYMLRTQIIMFYLNVYSDVLLEKKKKKNRNYRFYSFIINAAEPPMNTYQI